MCRISIGKPNFCLDPKNVMFSNPSIFYFEKLLVHAKFAKLTKRAWMWLNLNGCKAILKKRDFIASENAKNAFMTQ